MTDLALTCSAVGFMLTVFSQPTWKAVAKQSAAIRRNRSVFLCNPRWVGGVAQLYRQTCHSQSGAPFIGPVSLFGDALGDVTERDVRTSGFGWAGRFVAVRDSALSVSGFGSAVNDLYWLRPISNRGQCHPVCAYLWPDVLQVLISVGLVFSDASRPSFKPA